MCLFFSLDLFQRCNCLQSHVWEWLLTLCKSSINSNSEPLFRRFYEFSAIDLSKELIFRNFLLLLISKIFYLPMSVFSIYFSIAAHILHSAFIYIPACSPTGSVASLKFCTKFHPYNVLENATFDAVTITDKMRSNFIDIYYCTEKYAQQLKQKLWSSIHESLKVRFQNLFQEPSFMADRGSKKFCFQS